MKEITVNGVVITPYKQWAVNLIKREASGEDLQSISRESWREVLGYQKNYSAKKALEDVLMGYNK